MDQPEISQPQEVLASTEVPKKNLSLILCVGAALLLVIAGSIYTGMKIQERKTERAQIPPQPISLTPTPDLTANWKTYTSIALNISLKYPSFYTPVEKFSPLKSGQSIFIVANNYNFDRNNIALCSTYKEKLCLIPGKNWNQEKDIQPIMLTDKNAVSFFITVANQDGGPNVLHIVQTTEKPLIEVALSVDGMGGEEAFQKILSTFRFD